MALKARLEALRAEMQPRGPSLLITLFGDSLHAVSGGQPVWLGSLIQIGQALGMAERLVRTSATRLREGGWLEAVPLGRRAFYGLSARAAQAAARASARLYQPEGPAWDGGWRLVQLGMELRPTERGLLRQSLGWLGFGALTPQSLIHPTVPEAAARAVLAEQGLQDRAGVFRLEGSAAEQRWLLVEAPRLWPLEDLAAEYLRHRRRFQPFQDVAVTEPEDAALLQTLLVHDFRRILLKDPGLPPELAPEGWPGSLAQAEMLALRRRLQPLTEAHLREVSTVIEATER